MFHIDIFLIKKISASNSLALKKLRSSKHYGYPLFLNILNADTCYHLKMWNHKWCGGGLRTAILSIYYVSLKIDFKSVSVLGMFWIYSRLWPCLNEFKQQRFVHKINLYN